MLVTNSIEKGKRGEREFAKMLREWGFKARRGQQFSGDEDSPDVIHNIPNIHFEVKRTETLRLDDAMKQAYADAGPKQVPVVAFKRNRGKWVAILPMDNFLATVKMLMDLRKSRDENN